MLYMLIATNVGTLMNFFIIVNPWIENILEIKLKLDFLQRFDH